MTLHHVSLEVRRAEVPGEIRFWELLGFTETEPAGTIGERASWVQRGSTHIHLLYAEDPVVPPQGHAAVVVDDFDATVATLVEAGLTPKESTRHWGVPRAFVQSPAGHTVELMSEAPPQ